MVGAKELLKALGYRNETDRSLEFYEDTVPESDVPKVKEMTAELLVAKLETEDCEQRGVPLMELVQPPARDLPPPEDMFGADSMRPSDSGGQMFSARTLPPGSHISDALTATQHSGEAGTHKVSVCID